MPLNKSTKTALSEILWSHLATEKIYLYSLCKAWLNRKFCLLSYPVRKSFPFSQLNQPTLWDFTKWSDMASGWLLFFLSLMRHCCGRIAAAVSLFLLVLCPPSPYSSYNNCNFSILPFRILEFSRGTNRIDMNIGGTPKIGIKADSQAVEVKVANEPLKCISMIKKSCANSWCLLCPQ